MTFQAIIFDLDGVLIDSEPLWDKVDEVFIQKHNLHLPPDFLLSLKGRSEHEILDLYKEVAGLTGAKEDHVRERIDTMLTLMREKGELVHGARECIERMNALPDVKLALASSSPRRFITAVLEQFQIQDFFPVVTSGEDFAKSKPSADIYLETAKLLQVSSANCIAIEDSANGILSAKSAGMKCIALAQDYVSHQDSAKANIVVQTLDEITLELLESVFADSSAEAPERSVGG